MICKSCNIDKDISCFEHLKDRPNPRKICKPCRYRRRDLKKENAAASDRKKAWGEKNKDVIRQRWERSTYGVTKEEIGISSCIICGSTHRLCIDHCHSSEEVRGILCTHCNTGLGMFKDNTDLLKKAIQYLENAPHWRLPKSHK